VELNKAASLARSLMDEYGLHNWTFVWDQAKRRIGQTKHAPKTISLSQPLTLINPQSIIEDTIRHEIAHALVGTRHKHDIVWRRKAVEVGARPFASKKANAAPAPYTLVCAAGHKLERYRRPNRELSCTRCYHTFDRRYLFRVVQNTL